MWGSVYGKTIPRMEMLDVNMTIMEIKKHLFSKIKYAFKSDHLIHQDGPEGEKEINRCLILHIYDNLPFFTESKYSRRKAQCEFCKSNHTQADTCDIKIGALSANSEEGCH